MARRDTGDQDELVESVGGIGLGHKRVPGWLLFVIAGVVAWGLYYLITYAVTDTGTFHNATNAGALFLRF